MRIKKTSYKQTKQKCSQLIYIMKSKYLNTSHHWYCMNSSFMFANIKCSIVLSVGKYWWDKFRLKVLINLSAASHNYKHICESFVHRDYIKDDTCQTILPSLLNLQRFLCIWSLKNLWYVILHFCFMKYIPTSTFCTLQLMHWLLNSPYSFGQLSDVKVNVCYSISFEPL